MRAIKWVVEVKWILDTFPDAELHDDGVHIGNSVLPYNILHPHDDKDVGTWWTGDWAETIEQG